MTIPPGDDGPPALAGLPATLSWRSLGHADLPSLADLAAACAAADGGQPFAAEPGFLRRSYLQAGQAIGGFDGPALACAFSVRPGGDPFQDPGTDGQPAITCGMVRPAWRRQGIGGAGLDWALSAAGPGAVLAESEMLTDEARALYLTRGLTPLLAEHVMQLAAGNPSPVITRPPGLTVAQWDEADPGRFFAVYQAAFAERPGFPGWTRDQWVAWISDDEDFRADWTLLASADGRDVGFVAGEVSGWIAQLGVVPQARRRAVGGYLLAEVIRRMRAAGETTVTLNVATDNLPARRLYQQLGFRVTGLRGRYERLP